MILLFIKFSLPLLLGYSLFVGVTGKLNPLNFPDDKTVRKSWNTGVVAGATVCIIFTLYIHVAYTIPASHISTFLIPASTVAVTLAALFLAVLTTLQKTRSNGQGAFLKTATLTPETRGSALNLTPKRGKSTASPERLTKGPVRHKRRRAEVSPAYLRNANVERLGLHTQIATNDTVDIYLALDDAVASTPPPGDKQTIENQTTVAMQGHHLKLVSKASASVKTSSESGPPKDRRSAALSAGKLPADIALLESAIAQEKSRRLSAEKQSATLKRLLLNAKQDVKRCTVARAKALSTANKSIAFARQTVEVRARLEQELTAARATIGTSQKTIRNLQTVLYKLTENELDCDDTLSCTQQIQSELPVRRQELHAPVRVPKSAQKLTSGLVKKVARSRSAAGSNAQPKPAQ